MTYEGTASLFSLSHTIGLLITQSLITSFSSFLGTDSFNLVCHLAEIHSNSITVKGLDVDGQEACQHQRLGS